MGLESAPPGYNMNVPANSEVPPEELVSMSLVDGSEIVAELDDTQL